MKTFFDAQNRPPTRRYRYKNSIKTKQNNNIIKHVKKINHKHKKKQINILFFLFL